MSVTKQWGQAEWETYYADPMNFNTLFSDYKGLSEQEARFELSSSQRQQLNVIERIIEAKFSF